MLFLGGVIAVNGGPLTHGNILGKLSILRFGSASQEQMNALQRELKRFRRTVQNPPSEQAITNWFSSSNARPVRSTSLAFLYAYVASNVARDKLSSVEAQNLYDEVQKFLGSGHVLPGSQLQPIQSRREQFLMAMIDIVLARGRRPARRELDDFFYPSPEGYSADQQDESYYVMYRYSTTEGAILKTFMVCKKPQRDFSEYFSYLTFIHGGEHFFPDVVRESTGVILKYENCYQFFGYNYKLPSNRRADPTGYGQRRVIAKSDPRALETIAIEYADLDLERGLFPGLTMTMAASSQPIIARVALLHLGTHRSLGRRLSDEDVKPTELPSSQLNTDLRQMVARLHSLDCSRFPGKLAQSAQRLDWAREGSDDLAEEIRRMIDNIPAWELSLSYSSNVPAPQARGAIETYSRNTRNRPRP